MKILKHIILIVIILTALGLLCRGWLYRHLVRYKSVGQRTCYLVTDKNLIDYIETSSCDLKKPFIKDIIELGLSITSQKINFSASKNDNDPNKLIKSETAHCVGYASFYATICNSLLKKYNLANKWTAKRQIGQLYFLGKNIHKYFNSSFFKDHDFVTIENNVTGEIFAVDPVVNDYLHIDFITYVR